MSERVSARSFSGFSVRLVSALALAALALAAVHAGGPWLTALVAVAVLLMAREWPELCLAGAGARPLWRRPPLAALAFIATAVAALALLAAGRLGAAGAVAGLGAAVVALIARGRAADRVLLGLGLPYIIVPAAAILWLGAGEGGRLTLYWLFAVVWATDIGGYVFGKLIGGPKLAPAVSPGKTWAGLIGATALAAAVAAAFAFAAPGVPMACLAATGVLVSLAAQGGDLLESAVKRHFAVKDSGSIIPGHGGLFDRLDGLLAAALLLAALFIATGDTGISWR